MKIIVGVKRVVDYNVRVRLKQEAGGLTPDLDNLKMSMNPFYEIALEEAVRLREKGAAQQVLAVSVGAAAAQDVLRAALAAGADRAVLVEAEPMPQPLDIARLLGRLALAEQAGLVLLGKQAIDDDSNQTGQILAGLLGWGQAAFASAVTIKDDKAVVERETDNGVETIEVRLPAVITADLRLNEPRYAGLANIMKARKQPIERLTAADLGVEPQPQLEVLELGYPPVRKAGPKLDSVDALLDRLRAEGLLG